MQLISGFCFALALALAVSLGGQTLDYTWGPALLALAAALLTAASQAWRLGQRGRGTWLALAFLSLAWGWILWRCWGSPVREFGRSDALLAGGMIAACLWGLLLPAEGIAIRIAMLALALLGLVNLGTGLYQIKDPTFAWPFATRPALFPSGLFGHYNHLADFSLVSAAILVARFFFARDRLGERVLQAAGVIACVACVGISGSRGGILSMCVAAAVLVALSALVSWRDKTPKRRMLGLTALAMPLLLVAVAVPVLKHFQERRGIENGSLNRFADNQSRLHSMGLAVDITGKHPWDGGGSRSFGWEKYAAWKPAESGLLAPNDDFVHNEMLQVATDYGWTGVLLVGAAVLVTGLCGLAGVMGGEGKGSRARHAADAMACGGLAAMAGTLVHSNFSFVTHTFPGALYLGLALGFALPRRTKEGDSYLIPARPVLAGGIAAVVLLPLVALLGFAGMQGSKAYQALWPVFFGKEQLAGPAPGMAIDRVKDSMLLWPGSELAGSGAHLARDVSLRKDILPSDRKLRLSDADNLYAQAEALNPYDPEWPVNRANILTQLGKNEEAEKDFEKAVSLEGGMEGVFRARFYYARHLYGHWYQAWMTKERSPGEALAGFLHARDLLKEASTMTEQWVRGKEESELVKGLEDMIGFLEGAQIKPEPPR